MQKKFVLICYLKLMILLKHQFLQTSFRNILKIRRNKRFNCISDIIMRKEMIEKFYVGVFGEEIMKDKMFQIFIKILGVRN